jgi:hypothetical protein
MRNGTKRSWRYIVRKRKTLVCLTGIMLLFLSISGCGTRTQIKPVVQIVSNFETPPAEWLEIPQKPVKGYRTNGELYEYAERLENSFDVLGANMAQIKVWATAVKEREARNNASVKTE